MAKDVFVLQGENCLSENGETCWIEGVYSSEVKALTAKRVAEDEAIAEGKAVLHRNEDVHWEVCFTVLRHPVQ